MARTLRLDTLHEGRPYDPFREALYTPRELLAPCATDPLRSLDQAIFDHYSRTGGADPDLIEALARGIHDYSIGQGLLEVIGRTTAHRTRIVGIMGGHSVPRTDPSYRRVARLGFLLRQAGYRVVTGGGPGIMEAANLGAYLAGAYDQAALEGALGCLARVPSPPQGRGWELDPQKAPLYDAYQAAAREVLDLYPRAPTLTADEVQNLAVPTWFYGWEPTNLFADRVAKFFSNSLREDGLLSVSVGGVVYAPGSLGTVQEIFMDAAQNHYVTFGFVSPMVFLGAGRYGPQTPIGALVGHLSEGRAWAGLTAVLEEPEEVLAFLAAHPPQPADV